MPLANTPPPPRSERYASAAKPVNSRTAPTSAHQTALRAPATATATATAFPPGFRDRMARMAAQKRLGPSLSQALARGEGPSPLSAGVVLMVLGGTAAGVAAILLALRGAMLEFAIAMVAALGLFAGAWVRRNRERNPAGRPALGKLPIDDASLRALDAVCERIAPALHPTLQADSVAALRGIKASLVRMLPLLNAAEVDGHFTRDDLSYTVEFVRRYLPDTLEAYLLVPALQRGQATDGQSSGQSSLQSSADALLLAQLRLLQTELNQRETRLGQLRTGALEQQGRFLQAKSQQP